MSYLDHFGDQRAAAIHLAVLRVLEVDLLFRDASVTAAKVAAMLGETPQAISASLAKRTGENFSTLLARLRITEAQRLLSQPKKAELTLEEIGMLAGFSSRQTFYAAFQKHVGMTPKQYRQQVLCKASN
ncbi:MAG: helix-turn-helix transcriptional regulator [Bacteroidales bacterium]|nr:helix-turn-helix transcriptional regulator [Bacteroidales bacterium]